MRLTIFAKLIVAAAFKSWCVNEGRCVPESYFLRNHIEIRTTDA